MLMKGAGETDVSAVKRAPCFSRGPDISLQHVFQAAYNQPPLIAAPEVVMPSFCPHGVYLQRHRHIYTLKQLLWKNALLSCKDLSLTFV